MDKKWYISSIAKKRPSFTKWLNRRPDRCDIMRLTEIPLHNGGYKPDIRMRRWGDKTGKETCRFVCGWSEKKEGMCTRHFILYYQNRRKMLNEKNKYTSRTCITCEYSSCFCTNYDKNRLFIPTNYQFYAEHQKCRIGFIGWRSWCDLFCKRLWWRNKFNPGKLRCPAEGWGCICWTWDGRRSCSTP